MRKRGLLVYISHTEDIEVTANKHVCAYTLSHAYHTYLLCYTTQSEFLHRVPVRDWGRACCYLLLPVYPHSPWASSCGTFNIQWSRCAGGVTRGFCFCGGQATKATELGPYPVKYFVTTSVVGKAKD